MHYGSRTWTQTSENLDRVVVVPLGSLEQHGHHLPMLTDTMIISEIAKRAENKLDQNALFLPTLWIGASDHHLGFPGTVSISNSHYVSLLEDLLESLIKAGHRRIFLLNGHGGNITPGRQALYNVHLRNLDKPDLYLAFSSWWHIAADILLELEGIDAKSVTHACELETSMILFTHPELVYMDRAVGTVSPFQSRFLSPDFSRPTMVDVPRAFHQLSQTGAFGHPEDATVEKGERLHKAVANRVVEFILEFKDWPVIQPL